MVEAGQLVAKALKEEGVDKIFALCGNHINPIFNACIDHGIRIFDTRHEQAAALMAFGLAKITSKPEVCAVTAGPGFTNSLSGVANAHLSNTPMVLISGSSFFRDKDKLDLQELNQVDMIKPIVKWARVIYDAERIPEYIRTAFRHSISGKPGPVYIEIPFDIQLRMVDDGKIAWPKRPQSSSRPSADPGLLKEAAMAIAMAKRPVAVAGSGVWFAGAGAALRRFVEAAEIPLFTIRMGRGALPDDHPMCFGPAIHLAPGAVRSAMANADLILMIGARFNFLLNYGRPNFINPNATVIQIDIDGSEIGRNRDVHIGMEADAKGALEALACEFETGLKSRRERSWIPGLRGEHEKRRKKFWDDFDRDSKPIHPLRLCEELRALTPRDATLVIDGGESSRWGQVGLDIFEPGGYLDFGLFGLLGVGIPLAIAAKIARPDKQVVLFSGDGAMGFNMMEFQTAVKYQLPIVAVVNNDLAWGSIKHAQEASYGADRVISSDLGLVRYDKIAKDLGAHGEFVEDPDQIRPALQRALECGKPACVNVITDHKTLAPPLMMS